MNHKNEPKTVSTQVFTALLNFEMYLLLFTLSFLAMFVVFVLAANALGLKTEGRLLSILVLISASAGVLFAYMMAPKLTRLKASIKARLRL